MLIPLKTDPLIGKSLDNKYEILEVLGGGGMGVVYKARHKLMNRIVAIKMLHKFLVSTAEALRRFQNEAQVASALNHPNILTVFDFGLHDDGQPFMVMDYLEGQSLCDLLDSEGCLPLKRALNIFIQTCAGLTHAHENGILHRDLKPSNIMLVTVEDQRDFVKIVDFGVAKLLSSRGETEKDALTKTGEVFGSPLYMSPEQCRAKDTDRRSDVYAMGCLIYRALTGTPVFKGTELLELLFHQISDMPEPFSEACRKLEGGAGIERIAFKAMAKNPDERYQSMAELGRALKNLQDALNWSGESAAQQGLNEALEAKALLNDLRVASKPSPASARMSENFAPEPVNKPRISALAQGGGGAVEEQRETSDSLAVVDALSNSIHFAVGFSEESGEPVVASLKEPQMVSEAPMPNLTAKSYDSSEMRERNSRVKTARRMKEVQRASRFNAKVAVALAMIVAVAAGATMFILSKGSGNHAVAAQAKPARKAGTDSFNSNNFDQQYQSALKLCRENKFADAIAVATAAISEARKVGAPGQDLSDSLSLRAKAYFDSGNLSKSETDGRAALAACQTAKGENSLATAACESELARFLLGSARFGEAEPLLRKALTTENQLNAGGDQRSATLLNLAICEIKQNRRNDAKEALQKAIALLPPDGPRVQAIKHDFQDLIDSKADTKSDSKTDADKDKTANAGDHPKVNVAQHLQTAVRRHAYSTYGY